MAWIVNILLFIIALLWTIWVRCNRDVNLETPIFKWLMTCWDEKANNGDLAWNEFCAIMKYLGLCYAQKINKADTPETYANLVDMSPFLDEQSYMMGKRHHVTRRKSSSKTQKARTRKKKDNINENTPSDSEPMPKPKKKRQTKKQKELELPNNEPINV